MPAIDLPRVRHDTPGVAHVTHFNNAGASLAPRAVLDAMTDHLWLEARVGGYEAAAIRAGELDRFYDVAAALVNGRRDQVAFTDSATRAWDVAFYGIPLAAVPAHPSDRIEPELIDVQGFRVDQFIAYMGHQHFAEDDFPRLADGQRHHPAAFQRHRGFADPWALDRKSVV